MRGQPPSYASAKAAGRSAGEAPPLAAFWSLDRAEREDLLLRGIAQSHAYHFQRNTAYRSTVATRGIGPLVAAPGAALSLDSGELPRLLRATSLSFKSYVDILGTPFPQDEAHGFVEWLGEQVSIDLRLRENRFRKSYASMEQLLRAVERTYERDGLQLLTSSGTSGRATVIPRDRLSTDLTVESFYHSFMRYFGMKAEHRAIFMMPKRTRIAMAAMARFSVQRVGLPPGRVHFTIPFPAYPDQVRIRTGRTYRRGMRGTFERSVYRPVMTFLQTSFVDPQAVEAAISRLIPASAKNEKVLLFGSPAQLHGIAAFLLQGGRTLTLAPGSLLGTGGGAKETYPKSAAEIEDDLGRAFRLSDGAPVPIRDVYGMAEANWAAMQCSHGNYHLPPWVLAVTLDDGQKIQRESRTTGMLAFFDPFGGGDLFPAFFRTPDRVTLVTNSLCACGEPGSYLEDGSIGRTDLLGEAGCAAQV